MTPLCFCFHHSKVSIVAKQRRNELVAYKTEAGDELELLYMGELSAQVLLTNLFVTIT